MTLRQLHSDLWVAEAPLRFVGLEMGARMTVVRLPDGKVLVHSPIAASDELVREVRALGPIAYLVAPNRYHHLYVADWQRACPDAALYVAHGLDRKRPDLVVAGVLGDEAEPGWRGALEQVPLAGIPILSEVVFFHPASATLIATDLAFNIGHASPPVTRFVFRLFGTFGRLSPTLLERILVRDRAAFRRSFERVLVWPFERVIVAHGEVCEAGGRAQLMHGYRWVLGDGTGT